MEILIMLSNAINWLVGMLINNFYLIFSALYLAVILLYFWSEWKELESVKKRNNHDC